MSAVDIAERDRRIREFGGDPRCLHCQMSLVVRDWVDGQADPLHAMQVAAAMASVVGDLLEPCELDQRLRCIDSIVREICQHASVAMDQLIHRDADGAAPPKVH